MNTANTPVIPQEFENIYGTNSKYAFLSCIHELMGYLEALVPLLDKEDMSEARRVLHQMSGTAGLLLNKSISEQVLAIKYAVKSSAGYKTTTKEVSILEMELSRLKHQTVSSYPAKSVIVYGTSIFDYNTFLDQVTRMHKGADIHYETEIDNLEYLVGNVLPEILILLSFNPEISGTIDRIKRNYLGTTILQLNRNEDLSNLNVLIEGRS